MIEKPHKILFYDLDSKIVHVDSFKDIADASRTHSNMRKHIKERRTKKNRVLSKDICKIALVTVHSEIDLLNWGEKDEKNS